MSPLWGRGIISHITLVASSIVDDFALVSLHSVASSIVRSYGKCGMENEEPIAGLENGTSGRNAVFSSPAI